MTKLAVDNYLISITAKEKTAALSKLVEDCEDEATARDIYTEVMKIGQRLRDKHKFGKVVKIERDGGLKG